MGTISEAEVLVVRGLKEREILLKFDPKVLNGTLRNGGLAVICSDGDTDMPDFQKAISDRPHSFRLFGGSLLFAPSFRGFNQDFAGALKENIKAGMRVKELHTVFLYVHAPCGVANQYGYGLDQQIFLAAEAKNFFARDSFFDPARIHTLFHVKKLIDGKLEQNTYRIAL